MISKIKARIRRIRDRYLADIFVTDCSGSTNEPNPYDRSLLWLTDQAHQAEKDPNREWHGLQAEWDKLQAGTHPDPPKAEKGFCGTNIKGWFKHPKPAVLKEAIDFADNIANEYVTLSDPEQNFGYPAHSQQLHAAYTHLAILFYLTEKNHTGEETFEDFIQDYGEMETTTDYRG